MPTKLSAAESAALNHKADRAARWLLHHASLHPQDREDICQDLLLDLLIRIRSFDPDRGTLSAFAGTCFTHRASRLRRRARRENAHRHPVSLNAPLRGADGLTLGDTLSDADGYCAWAGQPTDAIAAAERRLDVERAVGSLPSAAVPLCVALAERTPHELAEAGQSPRTSLYRHIHAIRLDLLAAGIAPGRNASACAWVDG